MAPTPPPSGISWIKNTHKHCYDHRSRQTYSNLATAKTACAASGACKGVYDMNCDNSGVFYLCTTDQSTWTYSSGSCVFQKDITSRCQLNLKIKTNYRVSA